MNKSLIHIKHTIVAVAMLLLAAGCGQQSKPGNAHNVCAADSVATDSIPPTRIISGAPLLTEVLFALGQQHRLIGRTDYCKYPEEAATIPSVGSVMDPSIETIIEMKPDIVITSTHFKREVSDKINKLGIKTRRIFHQSSSDGAYKTIRDVARLTGCPQKGDSIIAQMEHRKTAILASIPKDVAQPSVYYVVGFGKNGDFTGGSDTFIHHLITLAGGRNIATDTEGWNYSLEKLMTQNPDIIIMRTGWKDAFCSQTPYNKLKAVQNNRVYEINKDLLEINGPRTVDGLALLVNLFYPAK